MKRWAAKIGGCAVPVLLVGAGMGIGQVVAAQEAQPAPMVEALQVRDNVYMLVGQGGNITMQIGADGILIVDSQFARMSDAILEAIREISDKPIRYIINTHYHGDHVGGNGNLRRSGDTVIGGNMPGAVPYAEGGGAQVLAHENVLLRLTGAFGGKHGTGYGEARRPGA